MARSLGALSPRSISARATCPASEDVEMPIVVRLYERADLAGVISLCQQEGWPSFPADPDRAHRAMTAHGVTTVVAFGDEAVANVVGFA